MKRDYYIGAGIGWGAQIGMCQDGPRELLSDPYFQRKSSRHIASKRCVHDRSLSFEERMVEIMYMNRALSDVVLHTYVRGERPCILGGDHSIAVGTWNGVKRAVNEEIGLVWIDAHMDSHTLATTPSGAPHGMPLAGLLGYGDARMSKLHFDDPVLRPEHICLIGTRSYEVGEQALLERLGVRIIDAHEVAIRGAYDCIREGVSIAGTAKGGFGVSFDLDVFDPLDAPGVGSREAGGLNKEDLLEALPSLFSERKFLNLEVVEYNPSKDVKGQTKDLAIKVLRSMGLSG
ncbi:MAG: arginase [Candidatus Peregrinibacteria bacterium]|nr:arginase [Candidatus Peregrinibacteria bacterium]